MAVRRLGAFRQVQRVPDGGHVILHVVAADVALRRNVHLSLKAQALQIGNHLRGVVHPRLDDLHIHLVGGIARQLVEQAVFLHLNACGLLYVGIHRTNPMAGIAHHGVLLANDEIHACVGSGRRGHHAAVARADNQQVGILNGRNFLRRNHRRSAEPVVALILFNVLVKRRGQAHRLRDAVVDSLLHRRNGNRRTRGGNDVRALVFHHQLGDFIRRNATDRWGLTRSVDDAFGDGALAEGQRRLDEAAVALHDGCIRARRVACRLLSRCGSRQNAQRRSAHRRNGRSLQKVAAGNVFLAHKACSSPFFSPSHRTCSLGDDLAVLLLVQIMD